MVPVPKLTRPRHWLLGIAPRPLPGKVQVTPAFVGVPVVFGHCAVSVLLLTEHVTPDFVVQ